MGIFPKQELGDLIKSQEKVAKHIADINKENRHLRMRLSQIASGDYKACGHTAEEVAADALKYKEDGK